MPTWVRVLCAVNAVFCGCMATWWTGRRRALREHGEVVASALEGIAGRLAVVDAQLDADIEARVRWYCTTRRDRPRA